MKASKARSEKKGSKTATATRKGRKKKLFQIPV